MKLRKTGTCKSKDGRPTGRPRTVHVADNQN